MAQILDGTVALVTGASSGIGEATARRVERLDALAGTIEGAGSTSRSTSC